MSLKQFINNLVLKHQIITMTSDGLIATYQDEKSFEIFLDTIISLIQEENIFFYLNEDFTYKVTQVVNRHHNKNNHSEEVSNKINYIAAYFLNQLEESSIVKAIKVNAYILFQEEMRKTNFTSIQDLYNNIAYDGIVASSILNDNINFIEDYNLYINSVEYLNSLVPTFIEDNSNIIKKHLYQMYKNLNIASYTIEIDYELK